MRIRIAAAAATLALAATIPLSAAVAADEHDVTLTLLHNNDGESSLATLGYGLSEGVTLEVGGAPAFKTVTEREIADARTKGNSVLNVYAGDSFLASALLACSSPEDAASTEPVYDALAQAQIPYDVHIFGNHEFDYGPDFLARYIAAFGSEEMALDQPFISANLDFSAEPAFADWIDEDGLIETPVADGRIIGGSAIVTDAETGERFGVVSATYDRLPIISSPRDVAVSEAVPAIQAAVDGLIAAGVDKIIFVSHLQGIDADSEALAQLSGIDIAVAGGGDELLANPDDLLVPGDTAAGPYPTLGTDASGNEVPVVTTSGGYRYVGQLVVSFDKAGNVLDVLDESGPVRVTTGASNPDAVEPDAAVQEQVVDPVAEFVADLANTPAGVTETPLDSRRGAVTSNGSITVDVRGERVGETNLGDLATDAYMSTATALAPDFEIDAPDLAITNGGGIRRPDDVVFPSATPGAPETLTRLDVNNQFPFPNFLTVSEDVPVQTLKGLLENAVSRVKDVDGRFAQVSNLIYRWDSAAAAEVREDDTCALVTPGDRVTYIALNPGNTTDTSDDVVLYDGVWKVDESTYTVNIASIDFLSISGGDCYDFGGAETTRLGVLYGQAVEDFIADDLSGVISAAEYPFEGTARVQQVG